MVLRNIKEFTVSRTLWKWWGRRETILKITEPLTVSTGQLFATIIKYLGEATYKRRRLTVQDLVDPISTAI